MSIPVVRGTLPLVLAGEFKPWAIAVTHSKLLIRGFIGDPEVAEALEVIDILFQDVSHFSLSSSYSSLNLRLAGLEAMGHEEQRIGAAWNQERMFLLGSTVGAGYVVAGFLFWAHISGGGGAPSPLLAEEIGPTEIRGNIYRC
ncbi:hypothetical protein [Actinomadura parmotrematis]|uniref:Uncharacterized protein n=1 Tax=Actinomadura parmotrematis TaxID=2864039 RepID=A0ABS7FPF2_9ACTN|nr:hypothetical protein [Actinomadura parmotrematis]MBW8482279.1 hypothetical protein [Actinomadura parmotrematis]